MSDVAIVEAEIDLHGFHASEVTGYVLEDLIRQAWEGGADRLCLIHGHGRARAAGIRVASFNTGFLGSRIRVDLYHPSRAMLRYLRSTVIDISDPGCTRVKLKKNPSPTRTDFDLNDVLPKTSHRRDFELDRAWAEHNGRSA